MNDLIVVCLEMMMCGPLSSTSLRREKILASSHSHAMRTDKSPDIDILRYWSTSHFIQAFWTYLLSENQIDLPKQRSWVKLLAFNCCCNCYWLNFPFLRVISSSFHTIKEKLLDSWLSVTHNFRFLLCCLSRHTV